MVGAVPLPISSNGSVVTQTVVLVLKRNVVGTYHRLVIRSSGRDQTHCRAIGSGGDRMITHRRAESIGGDRITAHRRAGKAAGEAGKYRPSPCYNCWKQPWHGPNATLPSPVAVALKPIAVLQPAEATVP